MAPPEENGTPGSGTPPTDAGGDPCPSSSSPSPIPSEQAVTTDGDRACRCGRVHAGDSALAGHSGGEPVAAADAVSFGCGRGVAEGVFSDRGREGGTCVGGDVAASIPGLTAIPGPTRQQGEKREALGESVAVTAVNAKSPIEVDVGVKITGAGTDARPVSGDGSGKESSLPFSSPSLKTVTDSTPGASAENGGDKGQVGADDDDRGGMLAGESQTDAMNRLAQSLAQVSVLSPFSMVGW